MSLTPPAEPGPTGSWRLQEWRVSASEGENPLLSAFEAALERLGATALAGNEEKAVVGYQELELNFPWQELEALLHGDSPTRWAEIIADHVVDAAAEIRAEEVDWDGLQGRLLPIVTGRAAGRAFMERAPDVLAYPYAEALLVTLGYVAGNGLRYLLRPQLEPWGLAGTTPILTAIENLRQATDSRSVQEVSGAQQALDTGDGLDSSRILILDELAPAAARSGVLAVCPAREVLSFAPFNHAGVQHLRHLITLAAECYRNWPHPIDDNVYYIAPQVALQIPVDRTGSSPSLRIPEVLAEVQAKLMEAEQW